MTSGPTAGRPGPSRVALSEGNRWKQGQDGGAWSDSPSLSLPPQPQSESGGGVDGIPAWPATSGHSDPQLQSEVGAHCAVAIPRISHRRAGFIILLTHPGPFSFTQQSVRINGCLSQSVLVSSQPRRRSPTEFTDGRDFPQCTSRPGKLSGYVTVQPTVPRSRFSRRSTAAKTKPATAASAAIIAQAGMPVTSGRVLVPKFAIFSRVPLRNPNASA